MKIKNVPFGIPEQWSPAWYRNHFVEVIARGDYQNGTYLTGSDVAAQITAHNADPFSHPDVINAHLAEADPHTQYLLKTGGTIAGDVSVTGIVEAATVYVNGIPIFSGAGTPESVVAAPVGSLFLRTDGGAGTSMYVKESGAGNTGWIAK